MKSVYFAARYSRRDELNAYRAELDALGIEVTSRWLATEPRVHSEYSDADWRELGQIDQEDVLAADTLVCFTEPDGAGGNGGRHVELGMALALGRRVIVVGRREHIFHHLPEIDLVESWPEALRLLAQSLDAAVAR
ncbi:MAG TPA: hypothetical protein VFS30_07990 [Dehalococcoidia bacterium]|nr:hypothetical protein [Dehalococcoidia bacterium]